VTETVRPTLPVPDSPTKRIRLAAGLLVAYGLLVVVNAVYLQSLAAWEEWPQFSRALVRLGGMLLFAWGLLHAQRWAWWAAVGLGLFWLITGTLLLVGSYAALGEEVVVLMPAPSHVLLVVGVGMLATAIVLLLTPAVRTAFRRQLQN
jgi:hypothetical protein